MDCFTEFFTTSHSSRDNVLQRLSAVISKLPDAVQEYLDDSAPSDGTPLEFEPELSSHERTLIQKRHEYLQNMSMEINKLQSYLDSMTELESDFGSSAVGVPKPPVTKPTLELSSQNVEAEQVYTSHLNNLGAYVSSVQSRLDEINASMANARASQDELYDACQKVIIFCIYSPKVLLIYMKLSFRLDLCSRCLLHPLECLLHPLPLPLPLPYLYQVEILKLLLKVVQLGHVARAIHLPNTH